MITPEMKIPKLFESRMFFTDREFGEIVGRNGITVGRWRRQGYIKGRMFGKRCVMIPRSELERFIRGEIDFETPVKKE